MRRQSAFSKALREAQKENPGEQVNSETAKQLNSSTVEQSNSEKLGTQGFKTVKQLNRETVKHGLSKTSFYLRPNQIEKLDDLEHECKKRTGKRIDRQDIIRALIDDANLESVLQLFGKR
jgi:proline dehydrogenase